MSPTKPPLGGGTLEGFAARLAGLPMAPTPAGGRENSVRGQSDDTTGTAGDAGQTSAQGEPAQQGQNFQGLGPLLENPDEQVFKQVEGLVIRQEMLAKNHLAQDTYYTCLVQGYPNVTLTHDPTRDVYSFSMPYGGSAARVQAVPNKNLDLVNKAAATVLSDFPVADPEPIDDSEEAEAATDLAIRFLEESASERGTNDAVLFDDRVRRALVTGSSYIEGWVDPVGGGYVPLQISAHPEAVDAKNPLVGPDGMPPMNGDYVLRYVTQSGQFTDDPSQAAPQWQPSIEATAWERTHIRVFPEDRPVERADKVIILGYTTISIGRRRWKAVGEMSPDQLNALCDWTPIRFLPLLPPFQRARWRLEDGREKERQGSSDERLFFYYHVYQRANPDYPKGADVVVSGIKGGLVINRDTLSADVPVTKGEQTVTENRCLEIPIVQITPRADPNGRDPSGLSYLEQFVGATRNTANLASSFGAAIEKAINNPYFIESTVAITGATIRDAAASGDLLPVMPGAKPPTQLPPPSIPGAFQEMYNIADQATDSIANQDRAYQGNDNAPEVSGKALSLAISRNNVGNTPMLTAVNIAIARWNRIKLERAMAKFTTPQLIKYEGDDGAYKTTEFKGVDFALVGCVSIKAGTGTMMTPDQKIENMAQMKANGLIPEDEALEAMRPALSKLLGLAADPHEQYVERCLDTWTDGPPNPQWAQEYGAWLQDEQRYEQQMYQYQLQFQTFEQYTQNSAIVAGGPPNPMLGPEGQNAQAMTAFQEAQKALVVAQAIAQQTGVDPSQLPQQPMPVQTPKPWTPFQPRPNDNEPGISALWMRKLSRLMSTTEYGKFGPEWTDVLNRQYSAMRQAAAIASGAMPASGAPRPAAAPQPFPAVSSGRASMPAQPTQPTPPPQVPQIPQAAPSTGALRVA